jgi:tetratricopeptide (TPR) repeat protein
MTGKTAMADKREPSYADLVHEVLRVAEQPLTFQQIFDQVNQRRPVTTKNPKATIRGALTEARQLVSLGDGGYGYLPHLLQGSLLRVPLAEKKPANQPLIYPDEVRDALWPGYFEARKRQITRPVRMRLRDGDEVVLSLEFFGNGVWGSPMPEGLRRYLVDKRAGAGDSLLIRVVDGEAGHCEAWFEPRFEQDRAAVAERNRELADAAYPLVHASRSGDAVAWDLVALLLGRGAYRSDVAPDPLNAVLSADSRFVDAGFHTWMLAENVTPDVQAFIRQRQQAERELLQPALAAEPQQAASPLNLRYAMERTMADVGAILAEQEFGSVDEINAYLQDMLARGGPPHRMADTPLKQAQELMYDAWDAPSARQAVRLARKALEISPDCADAYALLAQETARNPREAADLYARGVIAGERALGKQAFKEYAGHFWGVLETRPYMRARLGLAQALWAMDRRQEAIEHLQAMLRLNPGDNQGLRYLLLGWLFDVGDDAGVKKLLSRYPDDVAASWLYGRALHAFRSEGDTKRARKLRAEAETVNPHVPAYLAGRKRLPRTLPDTVGVGDTNEAIICASEQIAAWRDTPGALAWLEKRPN